MTAAEREGAASRWRSWASSLSGRITLIVLVALLVVQSIQVGFFIYDRTLGRSVLVAENIAARVVSVVELYETAAGPAERRMLLSAARRVPEGLVRCLSLECGYFLFFCRKVKDAP